MATMKKATSKSTAGSPPAGAYRPTAEDKERERRYRAEDAIRVITQAEKHKADRPLMADVKRFAKEQMAELAKVAASPKGAKK